MHLAILAPPKFGPYMYNYFDYHDCKAKVGNFSKVVVYFVSDYFMPV